MNTASKVSIALLLSINPFLALALEATGTVFEDLDLDGQHDASEPGIAGVRVSNGADIVVTDADGRYRITVGEETIVFITKPAGYATPVDQNMLPQFYYIHQPAGSPAGLRYPGINPTGALPSEINFALVRRPEHEQFEAILLSDPQPQTDRELDYIRDDVISELIGTTAVFGMTMGDILYDDMSMFPRYNALIGSIGVPWYNVSGNHEINLKAKDDQHSLETFKRYFGPPYYAFEYGQAIFVVLDNIYYKGNGESDPGDVRGNGGYVARLTKQQLKWLEKELSYVDNDKLVFIATHAPLGSEAGTYATENRERLFRMLGGRPNLYSVAGHTHTTNHVYFGREEGFPGPGTFHHHVLTTVSGAWWSGPFDERGIPVTDQRDGTPNGYHILEVDGTDMTVRYKGAGKPVDAQMRILFEVAHHGIRIDGMRDFKAGELLDGRMSRDQVPAASIMVNLFDGGPKSVVEYAINNGAFKPLDRVIRNDPFMLETYNRHEASKKSFVQATPSTHLFEADLMDDLPAGRHVVSVRARDEFGRTHHGHTILEITDNGTSETRKVSYPD